MPDTDLMTDAEGTPDAEGDLEAEGSPEAAKVEALSSTRRPRRRASLAAPAGSDPSPEDPTKETRGTTENDDRLRGDRPPHWG